MKLFVFLIVIVNALSCLAGHKSHLTLEPGCNDLQKGILAGTPLLLSYSIAPGLPNAYIDLPRDFYRRCPFGPSGVYVKSCESCPNCMAPTMAMVFEGGPTDRVDIYRSNGALAGHNSVQVTVYCRFG